MDDDSKLAALRAEADEHLRRFDELLDELRGIPDDVELLVSFDRLRDDFSSPFNNNTPMGALRV